ncbi:MAG: glycosyltransferase [Desulfobacter postgatei]|uniref:glycosyltransferase n=1 Tax=Desulfobacter postgatei TaxID=2293 RepID=UPI0023F4B741|nr:glycosyltransferase [Desulfobacter postgatei]MDD4273146.1 glycosyltransferase [Desulfobacter postgatei]
MISIRIVHVVYSFGIGGLEKGITTLINHGSDDIAHIIISLCGTKDSEKLLKKPAQIICLDKPGGNSPRFIWDLAKVIRTVRPDVVHTRNWSGMDGILAARLAGVKAVIHGEHGWDMLDPAGTSKKRRLIRKLTSLMVNHYTCVSRQLAGWMQQDVGIRKPVTQIYNGVDTANFMPAGPGKKQAVRQEMDVLPEDFVVGIVARLDAIKNHGALIDAVNQMAQSRPGVKLVVVGDGPEAAALKARAGYHVRFLGYRSDTARLMQGFDLFVLPSFNEGISNTILEAMATGLPVIASDVGGNPELVDDGVTGTLVDPYRPDQMANIIMGYLNNPDTIARHGEQGRKRALERFSIIAMVDKYEAVYNCL